MLSGRERLVAIQPITDGFRLTTLRSAKEVREPSTALDKLERQARRDMLGMATADHRQKKTKFAPEEFEDRYEDALMTLVKSKIAGGEPVITKAPERGNVVNLMDALRRSIEEERRPPAPSLGKAPPAPRAAKTAPAKAARRPRRRRRRRKPPDAMDLADRSVALYGRFSPGVRDACWRGDRPPRRAVARDLIRRSDMLVVGALATTLIDSGALQRRGCRRPGSAACRCWASAPSPPPWPARPGARRGHAAAGRRRWPDAAYAATTPRCWPPST